MCFAVFVCERCYSIATIAVVVVVVVGAFVRRLLLLNKSLASEKL